MIRDVTERAERERRLQRQNERLDGFAAIVSHDLRNPLNVAEGRLELAREECETEHLAPVASAHDRMRELIDDLLALARSGQGLAGLTSVALPGLAERCWDSVSVPDATLDVRTDATVRADEARLQRLLENLFRNAVEHGDGDGGGDVTLTVGDLPEGDGFFVADDGPGVPPAARGRAFEPGYSTTTEGTGLGLSIVRDVAEAHGWTVELTDADDGGARFEFRGVATE
jgi:signal transduction histidine kinase